MPMKKERQLGRPREFNEDDVVSKIMSVFWKYGYEATKLSHIVEATGLQKGSLYKVFTDKQDMYVKALRHYEQTVVQDAVKLLTDGARLAPLERLQAFLSSPIDAVWSGKDRRGCFLCNASADYAAHDDDTLKLIAQAYGALEKALYVPITQLRADWPDMQVENTARLYLSVYSGLRVMAKTAEDRRQLDGAKNLCLSLLV